MKTFTQKNCTWMFIIHLFIIIKNWKQPKYPSAGLTNRGKFIRWKLPALKRGNLLRHETLGWIADELIWSERQVGGWISDELCEEKGKTVSKGYTLYDSILVTFWKRQNYGNRKQISGSQGLEIQRGVDYKGAGEIWGIRDSFIYVYLSF